MSKNGVNVNKRSTLHLNTLHHIHRHSIQLGSTWRCGLLLPYWLRTKHSPTLQGWWRLAFYKIELIRQPQNHEHCYLHCDVCVTVTRHALWPHNWFCSTRVLCKDDSGVGLFSTHSSLSVTYITHREEATLLDYEKVTVVIYCMYWDTHTHTLTASLSLS